MIKQYIPMTDKERMWTIKDIGTGKGYGIFIDRSIKKDMLVGNLYWTNGTIAYAITELAQWINHSKNPNCIAHTDGNKLYLHTSTNIPKGHELTVDYTDYQILHHIRNIESPNATWN
jgi:hypothetical protein